MRPGLQWRALLRELGDHERRGYSELRDRELRTLRALITRADTRTGRIDATAGWLAQLAGASLVTHYRAIERLRDDHSWMPPHPRKADSEAPRLAPLGLVRVERTFPNYAACGLSKKACDAKHRADAKRLGKRGPGCVAHHGRVTLWLLVKSVGELRALLDGQAQHPVGRSVNRSGAENSGGSSVKTRPENSHSGSVPKSGSKQPPPSPEGSRRGCADVPGSFVRCEASNDHRAPTLAMVDGEPGRGPVPAARNPEPQTRAVEAGRAQRVPARLRADALELAAIVAGWSEGKPPMLEAVANRRDEGATLEELALCVESLRGSSQDAIYARERAHAPAAVVFATLESVRRFAAAGRSVRDRREQRERWARQDAENDRAFRASQERPSSSPPPDLAAQLAELAPMTPPPPPPMGPAEIARRRAEQLELLAELASGELVEVPIVGDVK